MSRRLSRRKLIFAGLAAGASGVTAASRLASRHGLIPPDHGGLFGVGETLTYASQRILMSYRSTAREFDRSLISKAPLVNGVVPQNATYERLLAGEFADWRLSVDGLVARPSSFSLAELKRYPARSQITELACEEGWSYIAQWTGVPLSYVLDRVGVLPNARYAVYFSLDTGWWDSIDLPEAQHPQTLLAFGMNGENLSEGFGAPLRLRVPKQLGYKSVKHLSRITMTDSLKGFGSGQGSVSPDYGYSWYAGI